MITQAIGQQLHQPRGEPFEDLIRSHLERLLRFVSFFLESDGESVEVVQLALRDMMASDLTQSSGLYGAACSVLRERPATGDAIRALEQSGGLCLLLKDLAGLRYAEIADVLETDAAQVRVRIASARAALLPAV